FGPALKNGNGFGELKIEDVSPSESGAVVTFDKDPPGDVPLIKKDSRWYMDLAGAAESASS
ncbi:MAG TPA: hypothetical protein PLV77_06965, partial [Solirubrobacterales bacterium]|nr:hypothetical protein [Solirubrobacterales bacterium]